MKTRLTTAVVVFTAIARTHAAVVAQWNFNSPVPDTNTATGTLSASIGSGVASVVGCPTNSFAVGDTVHDAAPDTDNSAWETRGYPSSTNSNKSAGARFDASTAGHTDIRVSWCQRNSPTASRYAQFQYTVDGASFVDAEAVMMSVAGTFTNLSVDLSATPGVADNPAFGFRLVTEFESTATGAGTNAYVGTEVGQAYGTVGTIRFDRVTISGTPIPDGNTPPFVLSLIPDQVLHPNQSSGPLAFLALDAETPASNLLVVATSSEQAVVPEGNILTGGAGADRTVTVTAGSQEGLARITVWVSDPGGKSNSFSFAVTVLPANMSPTITTFSPAITLMNQPTAALGFTVSDPESSANALVVTAFSANPGLVPNSTSSLALGGIGANRTLTVTPVPGRVGVAPLTVSVSDGTNSASASFALVVRPSSDTLLLEPFDYADGSLLTNSAFLWEHRSGTRGQCQVATGQLVVAASQSEDVVVSLPYGPYTAGSNAALYASFQARFLTLPGSTPGYFAHFSGGSSLRGRIFAGTLGALPGFFHLFVSNGSDAPVALAWNLSTNTLHTVVMRYVLQPPSTTLWLDPAAESDSGASATDGLDAIPITAFGFRQDADIGTSLRIDDLRVGLSFEAVTASLQLTPTPIPVSIAPGGSGILLTWTNAAWLLQAAPAPGGPYTNVPSAVSPFTCPPTAPAMFYRLRSN